MCAIRCVWALVPLCVSAICGCTVEPDPGVPEWLGEDVHFRAIGSIEGEALDIGEGGTIAVTDLVCKREYVAPLVDGVPDPAQATFLELQLVLTVDDAGETRYIEIEFKQHDLQSDAIGDQIAVVPRLDTVTPSPTEMWFEWEWHDELGDELLETSALDGVFTLEHYSGEPGPDGVVIPSGEGMIGGHLTARWSAADSIELSFTAPCVDTDVNAEG